MSLSPVPDESLSGDDAEDRLRELVGSRIATNIIDKAKAIASSDTIVKDIPDFYVTPDNQFCVRIGYNSFDVEDRFSHFDCLSYDDVQDMSEGEVIDENVACFDIHPKDNSSSKW